MPMPTFYKRYWSKISVVTQPEENENASSIPRNAHLKVYLKFLLIGLEEMESRWVRKDNLKELIKSGTASGGTMDTATGLLSF